MMIYKTLHCQKAHLWKLLTLHEHSSCKNKSPVGLLSLLLLLVIHVVWSGTESRDLPLHPSLREQKKLCIDRNKQRHWDVLSDCVCCQHGPKNKGPKVSKSSVHDLAPASFSISSLLTCWARQWELIAGHQWLPVSTHSAIGGLIQTDLYLLYNTSYINILTLIYYPGLLHESNCPLHKIPWHGDSMAETRSVFFQIGVLHVFAIPGYTWIFWICKFLPFGTVVFFFWGGGEKAHFTDFENPGIHQYLISVLVLTSSFSDSNAVNSFYRLLVLSHCFLFTARFCHMNAVQSRHAPATKARTKMWSFWKSMQSFEGRFTASTTGQASSMCKENQACIRKGCQSIGKCDLFCLQRSLHGRWCLNTMPAVLRRRLLWGADFDCTPQPQGGHHWTQI